MTRPTHLVHFSCSLDWIQSKLTIINLIVKNYHLTRPVHQCVQEQEEEMLKFSQYQSITRKKSTRTKRLNQMHLHMHVHTCAIPIRSRPCNSTGQDWLCRVRNNLVWTRATHKGLTWIGVGFSNLFFLISSKISAIGYNKIWHDSFAINALSLPLSGQSIDCTVQHRLQPKYLYKCTIYTSA